MNTTIELNEKLEHARLEELRLTESLRVCGLEIDALLQQLLKKQELDAQHIVTKPLI